jgi:hypothetical protein
MQTSVTLLPTQTVNFSNTYQVDAQGNKLVPQDASYAAVVWTTSNPSIGTIGGNPPHYFAPSGTFGTTTLTGTETSTDPAKPVLTSVIGVTVTGPPAADLKSELVVS